MGVQKFRSIEEMSAAPLPRTHGDALDRFLRQCGRYLSILQRPRPRGLLKFRNLEEAQQAREPRGR